MVPSFYNESGMTLTGAFPNWTNQPQAIIGKPRNKMNSLLTQSTYLILALFLNYLFTLLSPVLLVRIFDVDTYGRYREFMLYSMIIINFLTFAIPSNFQYFLPQKDAKESNVVSNTAFLIIITTTIGIIAIYILRDILFSKVSYDFFIYLIFYITFYLLLNFFENYCVAASKTAYLPVYSSSLAICRVSTAFIIAFFTRDLFQVLLGLILVEILKFIFLLFFFLRQRLLTMALDGQLLRRQIKYIFPLGLSGIINHISQNLSRLFISFYMGASSLAIYSIGSYNLPIIVIVRRSIYQVIFPEMVRQQQHTRENQLILWQRANVILYFILLPVAIVLFLFANEFVRILFTSKYSESVDIFRVYLFFMLRQSFEMGTPLKLRSKNGYFVIVQSLSLALNIFLISILFKPFGILGPALAFVISDAFLAVLLGAIICTVYKIDIQKLFMWDKLLKVSLISIALMPILIAPSLFFESNMLVSICASILYFGVYFCLVRNLNIQEINSLYQKLLSRIRL